MKSDSPHSFAVLFDWDGVIVDSSALHKESWVLLSHEADLPLPENHFELGFGKINRSIIPDILGWSDDPVEVDRLGARKEALYRKLIEEKGLAPLPGVRSLLRALAEAGIPRVVCTSTERANIETSLRILGMEDVFLGAICSEDVTHGKPDPEVFRKGAALCGMPSDRCVVIEDSLHGLEAARAGGFASIGVTGTRSEKELAKVATVVAPSLEVVSLKTFDKVLAYAPVKSVVDRDLPRPPHRPEVGGRKAPGG